MSLLFCTFIGFLQFRHRTRFRDSFCLASVFKCLFTYYLLTFIHSVRTLSVFAARCYTQCGLHCCAVSVCPSFTSVDSVEMIFKMFSLLRSHIILVFPYETLWQYSDGEPLTGASNAGVIGKNCDSRKSIWLLVTAAVRSTIAMIDRAVYHTDHHTSVTLVYHSQHGRPR